LENQENFTTMDLIYTIKNLINRKAFTLSENQMLYIHQLFQEFFRRRVSAQKHSKKKQQMPQLHPQKRPYPVQSQRVPPPQMQESQNYQKV
jgi:hypothetical protein